jgi:CHAT domain-containing protein/Tfp pilus assembly protein PilF
MRASLLFDAALLEMGKSRPDLSRAAKGFEKAAGLWLRAGFAPGQADALLKAARAQWVNKNLHDCIRLSASAGGVYRALDNAAQEAQTLILAGSAYEELLEFEEGRSTFQKAAEMAKRDIARLARFGSLAQPKIESVRKTILAALLGRGFCESRRQQSLKAIASFEEALQRAIAWGAAQQRALSLLGLGVALAQIGDTESALRALRQAEPLLVPTGPSSELGLLQVTLGDISNKVDDPDTAARHYAEALQTYRKAGVRRGEAVAQNNLTLALYRKQRYQEGLDTASKALRDFQDLGDRQGVVASWANLGWMNHRLGHTAEARSAFVRALTMARAQRLPPFEVSALLGLADLERGQGNLAVAQRQIERALRTVERMRSEVADSRLRSLLLAGMSDPFDLWIEILMQREELQPGKGWALQGLAVSEFANGRETREAFAERLGQPRPRASPEKPLVQEALRRRYLDDSTVLLEYWLTEREGFLWVQTRDSLRVERLPGLEALKKRIKDLHSALERSDDPKSYEQARRLATELSGVLLQPAAREIAAKTRVLIALPAALKCVPFAVLPVPQRTEPIGASWPQSLSSQHEVVSIPSLTAMAALRSVVDRRRQAPGFLALIYDPVSDQEDERLGGQSLPHAKRTEEEAAIRSSLRRLQHSAGEAKAIVGVTGKRGVFQRSGFEARRELVTSGALSGYRFLHFSMHGAFIDGDPKGASLVFSQLDRNGRRVDGYLSAHDIQKTRLRSDLAVLSACSSGMGPAVWGEGLAGLSQAFLRAGSARVMVSLWDVNDEATAWLMSRFYAGIFQRNLSPAAALREAQEKTRSVKGWQSPYYWGGFVLEGDWR